MCKLRWTNILGPFLDIFERLTPFLPFFLTAKGPPFWIKKNIFFKSPLIIFLSKPKCCIWSHNSKMVLHLGIENTFCKYLFKKYFQQYFPKKIISMPKYYTILESWDQMPHFGFDSKMTRRDIKKIFFKSKGE